MNYASHSGRYTTQNIKKKKCTINILPGHMTSEQFNTFEVSLSKQHFKMLIHDINQLKAQRFKTLTHNINQLKTTVILYLNTVN